MQFRGGMSELIRQASRMQRKIEETKTRFREHKIETQGANGQIAVTVNGGGEIVAIRIDPGVIEKEGLDLVQDALVATVNAGIREADRQMEAEIEKVTGGVKIPGMI